MNDSFIKIIEAQNITFAYNKNEVIKNISMSLERGEFLGIIGPNGAGKSTMLRILRGILRPQKGHIFIFGQDITVLNNKLLAQQIGFVQQETHFTLDFSVEDVISMGRYPYKKPFQRTDKKDLRAVEHALDAANVSAFKKRAINSLSSGERQRVVIARVLAQEPKILFLDEPTSHLDLHHQYAIMELLKALNAKGISIIVINHDLNLASLYCKRLILMHEGQIYAQGSPQSLLNEKTLKDVYKTEVRIIKHPHVDVPQIFLHPKVN